MAGIVDKSLSELYTIGLNGTPKEFSSVWERAAYLFDKNKLLSLISGADAAFEQGRPENWQHATGSPDNRNSPDGPHDAILITLCNVTAGQISKRLEKLAENDRREILDAALAFIAGQNPGKDIKDAAAATKNIIEAGANVHAGQEYALQMAAESANSDMVECLYKLGADFKKAILDAKIHGHAGRAEKLQTYQQYFTGDDPEISPKIAKILAELRQEIKELTEARDRTLPSATAAKPSPSAGPQ